MLTFRASSSSEIALLLLAMGWISAGKLSLGLSWRGPRPPAGRARRCGELDLWGRAPASSGLPPKDREARRLLRLNRLHSMHA